MNSVESFAYGISQNYFSLLSRAELLRILTNIQNTEFVCEKISSIFVKSFVAVKKISYNKTINNTLLDCSQNNI